MESKQPVSERSYQETIEYLFGLQKHGVKLALSNSEALLRLMGDPHLRFRTVHVAGTNGKGSTSAILAEILHRAGYRVGLYTSPHLVSFTERIRINGVLIAEEKVVELARRIRDAYRDPPDSVSRPLNPTFFEVTTALAFTYFAQENVDIAVIEVGMGGRLDATNVIHPEVSIITNIELEHTEYLGATLEAIAFEKAGVIKSRTPVVTGAIQQEALDVIERHAGSRQAPLYRLGVEFSPRNVPGGRDRQFDYCGLRSEWSGLEIVLSGRHQVENGSLALAALECLQSRGFVIDEKSIRAGLRHVRWEGRLELVAEQPDIYLDGAHNPAAAERLAEAVAALKAAYRRLVLIIGILGDKDFQSIVRRLAALADQVIVTKPDYGRALETAVLAAEVKKYHESVLIAPTVTEAVETARAAAGRNDIILITGSLYVVGDARAVLVSPGRGGTLSVLKG